jgi:ubiquinone/menaquinone biosynthesis C-methylase UbiE
MKRTLGCKLPVFYGDARFSNYHTALAQIANVVYISNKTHLALNAEKGLNNFTYMPCPTDPEVFHPFPVAKEFDLLFIGNNNNATRLLLLKRLAEKYDLKVAGEGWQETGLKSFDPAYGENFSRLCGKARILLGLVGDEWKDLEAYFSNRLVNVLASGAFLIQTYSQKLEEVFENGKHLVWYGDEEELLQLIDRYLSEEAARRLIGEQGRKEVLAKYTYDRSVAEILRNVTEKRIEMVSVDRVPEKRPEKKEASRSLRLNIGCGKDLKPRYVNIDRYNPDADALMDAGKLDYPDSSADEVFSSHMIEHVPLAEFLKILQEWKRVLKPGGRLEIRCPNFEAHIRKWLEGDEAFRWGGGLNRLLGIQDRGEGHLNRNMFTHKRLQTLVKEAGFSILRCEITATRTGEEPDGDILCIAVKPQPALKQAKPILAGFDQVALDNHWKKALDEAKAGGRFTLKWFREHPITRELLKSEVLEGHVLEIGCGLGQRAFIAHRNKDCRITGMDASWFAVGHATKTYGAEGLTFEVGDATRMPFPSRSFDNAYMLAVFEHIPDSEKLLREIRRVLKPGGKLFVSVTENNYHASPDHVHVSSHEGLRKAFAGLDVVNSYVQDHIIFLTARMPQPASVPSASSLETEPDMTMEAR